MFKNKFFKKVTSCCLTLAGVLSLSMPCNAKWINGNEFNKFISLIKNQKSEKYKKDGIYICEFQNEDKTIRLFYISLEQLNDFFEKCFNNNSNNCTIGDLCSSYVKKKTIDIFIIKDKINNNHTEPESIEQKIKNCNDAYFIYESEINNFLSISQKQKLFKFLGFKSRTYNSKPISKSEVFILLGILSLIVGAEIVGVVNKVIEYLR